MGAEGASGYIRCSPDGKLIAIKEQQQVLILPLNSTQPYAVPGIGRDDILVRWSADNKALYVTRGLEVPAKLFRVDITSGKRELIKQFAPSDLAGVEWVSPIQITPDLRYYSYGFARYLTDM